MKRRQVLKNNAAAMAALAASPVLSGAPMIPPSRKEAFATALRVKLWLSGFAHTDRQRFDATAKISGRWPEGVSGTLYRNGPAAHELGDFRHSHWYDGDGLLHAYRVAAIRCFCVSGQNPCVAARPMATCLNICDADESSIRYIRSCQIHSAAIRLPTNARQRSRAH